jgi:hypothetical protein
VAFWLLTILHCWSALITCSLMLALVAETSTALCNLETEMKSEGISSDCVRPRKFLNKVTLWLFGS